MRLTDNANNQSGIGVRSKRGGILSFFKPDNGKKIEKNILERGNIDIPLTVIFLVLIAYGAVMVFSASYAYSYNDSDTNDSFQFIRNQLFYIFLGIVIAGVIIALYDKLLNAGFINHFVRLYFLGALALLVLVLLIGKSEGEAKRWIILGPISIQPSEFAKGALIMAFALYFSKYENKLLSIKSKIGTTILGTILPFLLLAVPVIGLVFLENHTSGVIIIGLIAVIMVFLGEKKHYLLGIAVCGVVAVAIIGITYLLSLDPETATGLSKKILDSYPWHRIDIWLRPELYSIKDDLWQTTQGIYAIGSGGFMGVGFGQSRQKHLYVSQPQNDFIYTILCEELGFIGAVSVIVLFALLIWRGIRVGMRIPDTFSRMTVYGLTASIGLQAFLNMAVVTGVLPNTGISLPFFSYGGSSILSLMIEVGIILSLSRYAVKEK